MTTKEEGRRELERRRAFALGQGGPERGERHHASGRLTARERLDLLLDEGSLREIGLLAYSDNPDLAEKAPADAVITASIGFMAPATAVPVLYKRELEKEPSPAAARELARTLATELGSEFEPWWVAGRGSVHDVIHPEDTRKAILDGIFIGRSEIVTRQRRWSRYEF